MKRNQAPGVNEMDWEGYIRSVLRLFQVLLTKSKHETFYPEVLACLLDCIPGAAAGRYYCCDSQTKELYLAGSVGNDAPQVQTNEQASEQGIASVVFQTGRAEIRRTGGSLQDAESLSASGFVIAAPVEIGSNRLGVVVLSRKGQAQFRSCDLEHLCQLTRLIALAMVSRNETIVGKLENESQENKDAQSERISILAHEMRTPLTSIKGYSTALLMEEATFTPEMQREFLRNIDEQCDVLQELIHDQLESASIEGGALQLELEQVRIANLAQQVVDEFSLRGDTHRFVIDFPEDLPAVQADAGRVLQVLRNLMDNAVKYSQGGKLIVIRGEALPTHIVVSVSDQGIGIAPEHLNRLFEKYFRVKSGAARHIVGSGLGLPIARAIVEAHGGQIWADSQLDEGSTFHFTLPLRQATKDEANA